jgi:hypothetical protein
MFFLVLNITSILEFLRISERDHSEDQSVDGRRGSKWILGSLDMGVCTLDSAGSG